MDIHLPGKGSLFNPVEFNEERSLLAISVYCWTLFWVLGIRNKAYSSWAVLEGSCKQPVLIMRVSVLTKSHPWVVC